jgi:hypothetical protein
MSDSQKYNGWTNYATWRVNLEIFDGMSHVDFDGEVSASDAEVFVDEWLDSQNLHTVAAGWINSFLSDVDWQEIADHLNEGLRDEDADYEQEMDAQAERRMMGED